MHAHAAFRNQRVLLLGWRGLAGRGATPAAAAAGGGAAGAAGAGAGASAGADAGAAGAGAASSAVAAAALLVRKNGNTKWKHVVQVLAARRRWVPSVAPGAWDSRAHQGAGRRRRVTWRGRKMNEGQVGVGFHHLQTQKTK